MAMLFPYLELAASLFILLFAYYIGTRHFENKTARFFVRFAMVAFLSCIFAYSMRIAFTLGLGQDINRISKTLVAFSFAVFAHFALNFLKKEKILNRKFTLSLLYLPPILLGLLFFCTNWMFIRYEITSYGIISIPAPLYSLFTLQNIVYGGWAIYLLYSYSRIGAKRLKREQAHFIAIGALIPAAIGIVFDELVPLVLHRFVLPPTMVFDFALMILFIFIGMRRYGLFAISPTYAFNSIIETMPDALIVTNPSGRVLLLNEEAHKYFHAPKEALVKHNIRTLFEQPAKFEQLYSDIIDKNLEIERFEATLRTPLGKCLPSFINARAYRDEMGGLLGIIFVVRDIRG